MAEKVIGRSHEVLIRRVDKDNPESDYYEVFPVSTADNIYMSTDEDESLSEFLYNMRFKYNIFVENLKFPITSIQVFDGKQYGPEKYGAVFLIAKDFGLDRVDNTSDLEKPVNAYHQAFINTYVTTMNSQIAQILSNLDKWNAHIADMGNPHKVDWKQVTNNSDINPTELVDENTVVKAIKAHNESTDLTTLHPELVRQINTLNTQVAALNAIITSLENSLQQTANDTAASVVSMHDANTGSHPELLGRLQMLSNTIDAAIAKYEGMNGIEFTTNKAEELELERILNPDDVSYDGMYPSVNAIKGLLRDLETNIYANVEYLDVATQDDLNERLENNLSGILFCKRFGGSFGAYIFVYENGEVIAKYELPGQPPSFYMDNFDTAQTEDYYLANYGLDTALGFCQKSSIDDKKQSIQMWSGNHLDEFVINSFQLDPDEKLYSVIYSNTNVDFDFATTFPFGKGILFCRDIDYTSRPGVVIYDTDKTPTTQKMVYGIRNPANILLEQFDTSPSASDIYEMFENTGTGLVYVKNLKTSNSGIPGLEYWVDGNKQYTIPLVKTVHERIDLEVPDDGGTMTHELEFNYSYRGNPTVSIFLSGLDANGVTDDHLQATAEMVSIDMENHTIEIQTDTTENVTTKFVVDMFGYLDTSDYE